MGDRLGVERKLEIARLTSDDQGIESLDGRTQVVG